ncbi:hypothetical protein AB0B94_26070 [Micromonospora sp. NPDC048986]
MLPPHPVQQPINRDRTIRVDQQRGQHGPLAGVTEVDGVAIDVGLNLAE